MCEGKYKMAAHHFLQARMEHCDIPDVSPTGTPTPLSGMWCVHAYACTVNGRKLPPANVTEPAVVTLQ